MTELDELVSAVLREKQNYSGERLFTVGISGIDGAGKGYITGQLQEGLEQRGLSVANINIDPWQNPLPVRLRETEPAKNIYHHIFRWKEFFEQLIIPLQQNKRICLQTIGIRSDADEYYPLTYDFPAPDILLLEGILLFKQAYLSYFDMRVWISCSYETALERALERNVEKLSREKLISDYETYYHAAQKLHMILDHPEGTASLVYLNDPVLSGNRRP